MAEDRNIFDATYAARYPRRNAKKVQQILENLSPPKTLLDLGCNAGYVDAAVLERFPSTQCHGVDLDQSVVAPSLLKDSRFRFTASDVVNFDSTKPTML
ncbi:MAG: class I SAM-dependent methyltransferase [Pirellulales bacterium]|nr:class I SAM-dependent methyltransferase [Pirellulales bacterium]